MVGTQKDCSCNKIIKYEVSHTMNITQEFAEYQFNKERVENYHMNIYQSDVSNTIDNRMIQYAKKHNIDDITFKSMTAEYKHRIKTQCMMTIDWNENYTKILARAYKGVMRKYIGE